MTKKLTMTMDQIRQLERGDHVQFSDGTPAQIVRIQGRGARFHSVHYVFVTEHDGREFTYNQNDLKGRLAR